MNPHTDEILEGLRPRMQTARVAHVRRMLACLAMVPLIGFGAVAMAANGTDEPAIETADGAPDESDGGTDAPAPDLPEIGAAGGDVAETPDETDSSDDKDPVDEAPEDETKVLSLGPLGSAEVSEGEEGFELLHTDLVQGWEVVEIDITDDGIVMIIKKGDSLKVIRITEGVRDEIDVKIEDLVIPTTTTTTTTTTTAPPEEPKEPEEPEVIVDRFTVTVEGRGSFIVEREGETLWVGNVSPNEGYDYDIVKSEGWKVYVGFTNGEWVWYGKALINDDGEVELHFWDEEPPFEPVFQWVEVPEVGAVKFKLWSDGLVYVKDWELGEGFGFWDYNEGSPAEVAKIDFEGEGILWIVEAWGNEEGGLSYSVTDASPE